MRLHDDQLIATTRPDYVTTNPVLGLLALIEGVELAAGGEAYHRDTLHHLFAVEELTFFAPSDGSTRQAAEQDDKLDFQKQNLASFTPGPVTLVRGRATAGDWSGPFLRVAVDAGDGGDQVDAGDGGDQVDAGGDHLDVSLRVGERATEQLRVPRSAVTGRYEIELWGHPGDLGAALAGDARAAAALARGELVARPDLVTGDPDAFARPGVDARFLDEITPDATVHPILPLTVEVAWAGSVHRHAFAMIVRGWDHFLSVGSSPLPHGGLGTVEYRNLLSNYGRFAARPELGRTVEPWMTGADGLKPTAATPEGFFAVEYVDLHRLSGGSAIGLHRHRDNTEVFFVASGRGLVVVGDWCEHPDRARGLEVRPLTAGHLALLHGGQLHALVNLGPDDLTMLTFGGYD
jgi:mannose-6-phosphate isomerase-like protein (cupin superfamily)